MTMRDTKELAWAAGLFEGEGYISIQRERRPGRGEDYIRLGLQTTDEDVVQRFSEALGIGHVSGPYRRTSGSFGRKPYWRWQTGGFEQPQAVLAALWFGLGKRRRSRAHEVLDHVASFRLSG